MIWPDLECWLERHRAASRMAKPSYKKGVEETDLAAQGFLQYWQELRIILLQDSAVLQHTCPASPFFHLPLFSTPEFRSFAEQVLEAERPEETPMSVQIRNAVPPWQMRSTSQQSVIGRVDFWGQSRQGLLHNMSTMLGD